MSKPTIHYMVQYTPEWWEARRGLPTASGFDRIVTPTGKTSRGQAGYICELIGEKYALDPNAMTERPMNAAMRHGADCEPEARAWYSMETGNAVQLVGGVQTADGRYWASPDGLIGDEGSLELKCPQPKTHTEYLLDGVMPSDYVPQVHAQLFIMGRKWVDFVSYCPPLPAFMVRVVPDNFTWLLKQEAEKFYAKLHEAAARVAALAAG